MVSKDYESPCEKKKTNPPHPTPSASAKLRVVMENKKNIICEYRNKKNFLFLDYFLAQNMNGHRQKMYEETWSEVQYLPSGLNLTTLAAGVCHVNTGRKGFPQESEECVTSK